MLHRCVEAVLPEIGPAEERFRSLAMRLEAIALERRNATVSVALGNELGLPFEATLDREFYVSLPLREMKEDAPNRNDRTRLLIRPGPDWQWELSVRISGYCEFSENDRKVFRSDLRLLPLEAGNLASFPGWLKKPGLKAVSTSIQGLPTFVWAANGRRPVSFVSGCSASDCVYEARVHRTSQRRYRQLQVCFGSTSTMVQKRPLRRDLNVCGQLLCTVL